MIEPTAAIEQLTNHQQQADMDGCFVTVSRQALEEVLDYLRTPPASQSDEALAVQTVETVTGEFFTEPGEPFYRIVIDGYCADFDHKEAAQNFADAISAREAAARRKGIEEAAYMSIAISLKRIADHLDERVAPKGHTYHGLSLDELARGESYHPGDDA